MLLNVELFSGTPLLEAMKVNEADDQSAKPFAEQLGRDNVKAYWSSISLDPNHFGFGRELLKVIKEELDDKLSKMILDMVSASVVQDKKTPKECDIQICLSCNLAKDQRQRMPMMTCYGDSGHAVDVETRRSTRRFELCQTICRLV